MGHHIPSICCSLKSSFAILELLASSLQMFSLISNLENLIDSNNKKLIFKWVTDTDHADPYTEVNFHQPHFSPPCTAVTPRNEEHLDQPIHANRLMVATTLEKEYFVDENLLYQRALLYSLQQL